MTPAAPWNSATGAAPHSLTFTSVPVFLPWTGVCSGHVCSERGNTHTHTHNHQHRQTHTHTQFMIFYRLHANTPRLPEHSFILSLFLFHTLHSLVRSAATVLQQQSVWQTWLLLCIVALPADRLWHSGSELNAGSLCTPPHTHIFCAPSSPPALIHHPVQPQRIYSSPVTLSLSSPPENNHRLVWARWLGRSGAPGGCV